MHNVMYIVILLYNNILKSKLPTKHIRLTFRKKTDHAIRYIFNFKHVYKIMSFSPYSEWRLASRPNNYTKRLNIETDTRATDSRVCMRH